MSIDLTFHSAFGILINRIYILFNPSGTFQTINCDTVGLLFLPDSSILLSDSESRILPLHEYITLKKAAVIELIRGRFECTGGQISISSQSPQWAVIWANSRSLFPILLHKTGLLYLQEREGKAYIESLGVHAVEFEGWEHFLSFLFLVALSPFRTPVRDHCVTPVKASHQTCSFPPSLLCLFEKAERPGPPTSWPHLTGEPSCGLRWPAVGGLLCRAAFQPHCLTARWAACLPQCVHTRSAAKLVNKVVLILPCRCSGTTSLSSQVSTVWSHGLQISQHCLRKWESTSH